MTRLLTCTLMVCGFAAFAADTPPAGIAKLKDGELSMVEREIVPLAEAMPADKYNFAPTNGEFKGVRTFSQQMSHAAAVMYAVSASVLGEKNPTEMGKSENGPASLNSKEDVVKYLKDAFAYGHRAITRMDNGGAMEMVRSAFGDSMTPRLSMADVMIWHTFDHYGQAVVYARMNGVVPPASRR